MQGGRGGDGKISSFYPWYSATQCLLELGYGPGLPGWILAPSTGSGGVPPTPGVLIFRFVTPEGSELGFKVSNVGGVGYVLGG